MSSLRWALLALNMWFSDKQEKKYLLSFHYDLKFLNLNTNHCNFFQLLLWFGEFMSKQQTAVIII